MMCRGVSLPLSCLKTAELWFCFASWKSIISESALIRPMSDWQRSDPIALGIVRLTPPRAPPLDTPLAGGWEMLQWLSNGYIHETLWCIWAVKQQGAVWSQTQWLCRTFFQIFFIEECKTPVKELTISTSGEHALTLPVYSEGCARWCLPNLM